MNLFSNIYLFDLNVPNFLARFFTYIFISSNNEWICLTISTSTKHVSCKYIFAVHIEIEVRGTDHIMYQHM